VREGGNDDDDDDDDKQESEDGVDELEDKHALDTQAEIAWRKLSTVFPNLEKEELIHEHKSVDEILDTIRRRIGKIKQIGTLETIETNDEDEFGEQVSVLVADKADEEAEDYCGHWSKHSGLDADILQAGITIIDLSRTEIRILSEV